MKRGDLVRASGRGDFSRKPRPALVVQSDAFNDTHASVTLCPVTSDAGPPSFFRIQLRPDGENGLERLSEVQVDKVQAVRRIHVRDVIGRVGEGTMNEIDGALRLWLDL